MFIVVFLPFGLCRFNQISLQFGPLNFEFGQLRFVASGRHDDVAWRGAAIALDVSGNGRLQVFVVAFDDVGNDRGIQRFELLQSAHDGCDANHGSMKPALFEFVQAGVHGREVATFDDARQQHDGIGEPAQIGGFHIACQGAANQLGQCP
ncbi:hypothetical protein [Blastomonas sp.]|uniref:hypothetical protein n=1 Tax=Blastomonas sp. TaxID=1909299 RepID=UPI0026033A30|nr:hypothetical protein [Blastomonas sp.]MDM7956600.1 hypothetical protein [Blastomonas sp.]